MKNLTLVLSIIAAAFVLASCASNTAETAPAQTATHGHHDYKGEK